MGENYYTGFSNCKSVAEFETRLKLKKIARKNTIKMSTEAILQPERFLSYMDQIRDQIKKNGK